MAASAAAPDGRHLIEQFAERLVRRHEPPPLPPDYLSAASIQGRLADWLRAHGTGQNARRYATQARLCFAFLERPEWTTATLAAHAGFGATHTVGRALAALQEAGLVQVAKRGKGRCWSLTAAGEQWLLTTARGRATDVGVVAPEASAPV